MRIVITTALVATSLFALSGCGPELRCGQWLTYDNCTQLEQAVESAASAQQRNDLEQCYATHCEGPAGGDQEG
jgi:hypothetical protein